MVWPVTESRMSVDKLSNSRTIVLLIIVPACCHPYGGINIIAIATVDDCDTPIAFLFRQHDSATLNQYKRSQNDPAWINAAC